jgi:opacity protein-like surface antigen
MNRLSPFHTEPRHNRKEKEMKRIIGLCFVMLALIFSGSACSQETNMYAALFGGYSLESFDQDLTWESVGVDPDEINGSWLMGVLFGYNFMKSHDNREFLAFEGSLTWLNSFKPDDSNFDKFKVELWNFMGSIKYKWNHGHPWSPYIIGGIGYGQVTAKGGLNLPEDDVIKEKKEEQGFLVRIGSGIEFNINEKVFLFTDAGYNITMGDIEGWNFWDLRVGAGMRF